jgi:hypothetical protein
MNATGSPQIKTRYEEWDAWPTCPGIYVAAPQACLPSRRHRSRGTLYVAKRNLSQSPLAVLVREPHSERLLREPRSLLPIFRLPVSLHAVSRPCLGNLFGPLLWGLAEVSSPRRASSSIPLFQHFGEPPR